jgi:TetR/AcrR family transcriptional repressor of nem operon
VNSTKKRLIDAGLRMLLEKGYNGLGIQAVLEATGSPKGSFYHHFTDKEDFALKVVDAYILDVHALLGRCVNDRMLPPLDRVRLFFETVEQSYRNEGYMGCLMGGLGQELAGVSEVFRQKIEWCFSSIAEQLATSLEEARLTGAISVESDARRLADLLVDCWEGAALRSRLRRDPASLKAMLDFYLRSLTGANP